MSSPGLTENCSAAEVRLKESQAIDALTLTAQNAEPKKYAIDIVIPVYKGLQVTLDCLSSVLQSDAAAGANIIVIDDASPDKHLSDALQYLAAKGVIKLIKNDVNLGFVRSVNMGMSLSTNDVILLNSDTLVYGDWVARLMHQAKLDERIGSVTPFSDNATLCSYPLIYDDNDFPLEVTPAELDSVIARVNHRMAVDIPTAVGFCMYIKRTCLDDVGLFDAESFGLGYGEENDFCCRAIERGWRHVLAGDVFVTHVGSVSFGSSRTELQRVNGEKLTARYPDFLRKVAAWSSLDPLLSLRQPIDIARVKRGCPDPVLFICHDLGGGTERHLQELCAGLKKDGQSVIFMRPIKGHRTKVFLEAPDVFVPNLNPFDFIDGEADLVDVLRKLNVRHIHVHSLFDLDQRIVKRIPRIAEALGVKYDVTLHEYLSICPRTFLIDHSGVYCGEPDASVCQLCVDRNGSHFGKPAVQPWRDSYEHLLEAARKVFVPNEDVAVRINKHYRSVVPTVRPHPEELDSRPQANLPPRRQDDVLRVALIGVLSDHKGARVIEALCNDATDRHLPVEFILFGERERPCHWNSAKFLELGPYEEDDIFNTLAANPCHLALFPAVWPETYSYTFTIGIRAGLYPVSFDIGAIGKRIKSINWGTVLPLTLIKDAAFINDLLLQLKDPPRPAHVLQTLKNHNYESFVADYYELDLKK